MTNYKAEFIKTIQGSARYHDNYTKFRDFCFMAAVSIKNTLQYSQKDEEQYLQTINRYESKDLFIFSKLLAITAEALTEKYQDFLGTVFHELQLHSKYHGQFFTPYHVSKACALMVINEDLIRKTIEEKGFFSLNEPTCGAGGMVIAACETLREKNINYQKYLYVVAQDIAEMPFYMTYIQLSLIGCPAEVLLGNTLKLEVVQAWPTPFYIMNYHRFNFSKAQTSTLENEEKQAMATETLDIPQIAAFNNKPVQLTLF